MSHFDVDEPLRVYTAGVSARDAVGVVSDHWKYKILPPTVISENHEDIVPVDNEKVWEVSAKLSHGGEKTGSMPVEGAVGVVETQDGVTHIDYRLQPEQIKHLPAELLQRHLHTTFVAKNGDGHAGFDMLFEQIYMLLDGMYAHMSGMEWADDDGQKFYMADLLESKGAELLWRLMVMAQYADVDMLGEVRRRMERAG